MLRPRRSAGIINYGTVTASRACGSSRVPFQSHSPRSGSRCPVVVFRRVPQEVRNVLGEEIPVRDELQRRGGVLTNILILVPVSFLDRQTRIARALPIGARARERNVGSDLSREPVGPADRRVAIVPT